MIPDWTAAETNTHQDHVIAHVIGATVLGHFSTDQAAHLLLDIGFIWTIYVDGEMGLVPDSVAIAEVEASEDAKAELVADAELLHDEGLSTQGLTRMSPAPVECLIKDVLLYAHGERRRVLINGEEANLAVESNPAAGEVMVREAVAGDDR